MVITIKSFAWGLLLMLVAMYSQAQNDYPHSAVNGITCFSCHDIHGGYAKFLKVTNPHPPAHIDDTEANNLCWSCHNDVVAPYVNPHSSRMIDEDYGQWALQCITCHNPHRQDQYRDHDPESRLEEGFVDTVAPTTITVNPDPGWTVDEFAGMVVYPNTAETEYSYRILSNTSDTLSVSAGLSGNGIDLTKASAGDPFVIIYGRLFKSTVERPNRGTPIDGDYANGTIGDTCGVNPGSNVFSCDEYIPTATKFLRDFRESVGGSNEHSFAGDVDGDGIYQGPCEACHTRTRHHRNNNDWPAKADHTHNVGIKCTFCHKHVNGFLPLGAGAHEVHLTKEFGPKISCSDGAWGCHGSYVPGSNYPNEVIFADGLPLCTGRPDTPCPNTGLDSGTQVCANCHGEGAQLAKYYFFRPGSSEGEAGLWITPQSGNYTWNDTWLGELGEAKFCGSCHNDTDNPTPVAGPKHPSDKNPPNVVGDLDLDTGISTYGFFKNGHGKPDTENYQRLSWQSSSETGNPGAGRICSDCHEYTKTHWNNPDPTEKRLKAGFENDAASTVCDACHGDGTDPGDIAVANPKYYTNHTDFENSAHGADSKQNLKCTDCHDPHGVAYQDVVTNGTTNAAMTKGFKQQLCYRCHTDDSTADVLMNVQNFAVTGHRGTHDGANDAATLTDEDASYRKITVLGSDWTVFNLTDGSSGPITSHYGKQITATLTGGTDNDWDAGDEYHIVFQGGGSPVDSIEEAFSLTSKHPLGTNFTLDGETYTLNCVSCHNVHLVTGQYWEADQNKAPVNRISKPSNRQGNLSIWGDEAGEKMQAFAGSGFYQTPFGDTFDETQLPAYPSFCLDCHSQFGVDGRLPVNWGDVHGTGSAGVTAGSSSPDAYYKATKTNNWPRTEANGYGPDSNYAWPKHQAGRGRAMWSHGAYESADRFVGINYVLSCTDCHEPHGSNATRRMGRPRINGGAGSLNVMGSNCAANCHFRENSGADNQYTPHTNGGGCGYGSCHGSWDTGGGPTGDSIHNMAHAGGGGSLSRRYDFDEVLDMRFEGNLNDSGTWNMSGQWAADSDCAYDWSVCYGPLTGSFGSGVDGGQALLITNQPLTNTDTGNPTSGVGAFVEPGSTNGNWSTDGTHRADRFFSFKYGLAFEMWINPSDYPALDNGDTWQWATPNRYLISKATWGNWADYSMMLKYLNGAYRLYFQVNVNGGGDSPSASPTCYDDDCGWRGAYSTEAIPTNQWTHVAVTYDASQYDADHDPNDLSKGRIRIYVNGEDVTTNDVPVTGLYENTQPLDGEGEGENPGVGNGLSACTAHLNTGPDDVSCQWRLVIGSKPHANSLQHFEGRIDNVKIWNVTKPASYFDGRVPPVITKVEGIAGYDKLHVEFNETAYANTDGTGALQPADFVLTDSDDGRTITAVDHVAGATTAILTLSSALDDTDDIGIDTLAPAANSIYDENGSVAALTSNSTTVTALPSPTITSVEGAVGSAKIMVSFSDLVYSNTGMTGALQPSDFVLTDADNGRTILSVSHIAGEASAILTLSSAMDATDDFAVDYISVAGGEVFDRNDYAIGTANVLITEQAPITVVAVTGQVGFDKLEVRFSGPVYAETGATGSLTSADFVLTDTDNSRSIIAVDHIPGVENVFIGEDVAWLTLDSALDSTDDINVDTLAANGIYNFIDVPVDTTPVTITGMPASYITSVEGIVGSDRLKVTFAHWVYSNEGETGALLPADFLLTDTDGNNPRSITAVQHNPGDSIAYLTMSAPLTAADAGVDTLAAVTASIFNSQDHPVDTTAVPIQGKTGPSIVQVWGRVNNAYLRVLFSEGVWTGSGQSGALVPGDFTLTDLDNGRTIIAVTHTPGSDLAVLELSSALDSTEDQYTDTLSAATASSIYNAMGIPMTPQAMPIMNGIRPHLIRVEGVIGSDKLYVTFESGVYGTRDTDAPPLGPVEPGDFAFYDSNGTGMTSISAVTHTPGDTTMVLTMDAPLEADDVGADSIGPLGWSSIWDITKVGANKNVILAIEGQVAPRMTGAKGMVGSDKLAVTFSEGVYANTGMTGALTAADFVLTDTDNSRTITGVTHTAGSATAILTLSSVLDSTDDIDVDTLAANGIYNDRDNPMDTTAITVTGLSTSILAVEGSVVSNQLKVTFSDGVYTNSGRSGALQTTDFTLTDTNGDNARTLTGIIHTAGDDVAYLTMSGNLIAADIDADTLAAASASAIYNDLDQALGTTAVTITGRDGPVITRVEGTVGLNQLIVNFSEGVYTATGQSGALQIGDFALTDIDNGRTITAVEHAAGSAAALLTLSSALDAAADIDVDTVAAVGGEIFGNMDNAVGTVPVTVTTTNCPIGEAAFNFSEGTGSATTSDDTGIFSGIVGNPTYSMLGDGLFTGDPTEATPNVYIEVLNRPSCMVSPRAVTLESRFYMGDVDLDYVDVSPANGIDDDTDAGLAEVPPNPFSLNGDGRNYTGSLVFLRDDTIQWMIHRANYAGTGVAAYAGKAKVEIKYRVTDAGICDGNFPGDPTGEGAAVNGALWRQISSDKDLYPIVDNHWYEVKVVINVDKPRLVVDIFADDLGTDGANAGELWSGFRNISQPDPEDSSTCQWAAIPGLEMRTYSKRIYMGDDADHTNPAGDNNNRMFKGKIDWFRWKPFADYTGVDDPPL